MRLGMGLERVDDGGGLSRVDPSFWVFDARGNSLLLDVPADDDIDCTVPTACGFDDGDGGGAVP